jgi:hypothetical protein
MPGKSRKAVERNRVVIYMVLTVSLLILALYLHHSLSSEQDRDMSMPVSTNKLIQNN